MYYIKAKQLSYKRSQLEIKHNLLLSIKFTPVRHLPRQRRRKKTEKKYVSRVREFLFSTYHDVTDLPISVTSRGTCIFANTDGRWEIGAEYLPPRTEVHPPRKGNRKHLPGDYGCLPDWDLMWVISGMW
ncbi:hypothetical protein CDAR_492681 [Caerostris darwini]|uniref:Uncharacterized protein n=1 Tax=Caerostris darwini TaxID=1538125 RepID=A0AAV4V0F0_9ARAC|nr:hypothetical protein CDAR_492681 [Caerostris darwini]